MPKYAMEKVLDRATAVTRDVVAPSAASVDEEATEERRVRYLEPIALGEHLTTLPVGDFSCVVIDRDAPGLDWGAPWEGLGMRGNSSRSVELRDVPVPRSALLGEPGDRGDRDARAAHVMSPTTDLLRLWTGRAVLGEHLLAD